MLFAVPAAGRRKSPRASNDDSVQVSHRDDTTVQRMSKKRRTTTHHIIFCCMLVYFLKICITFIKRTNQILITLKKKKLKMIRHLENGLIKQQNGNIQLCDTINNLQNDFVRLFLLRQFQSNKKTLFSTGYKRTPEMCGRPRILASKDYLS